MSNVREEAPIKKKRAPRHYVNNGQLFEEIVKHRERCAAAREAGKPEPLPSNYVGECILMICRRMATRSNFSGYSYRDEMVDDAIENCVAAIPGFDPNKSIHPFNYLSTVAWNAMVRRISQEKRETYLKHKTMQNMALLSGSHELIDERSMRVVADYEAKMDEKRASNNEKTRAKQAAQSAAEEARRGVENFIEE